MFSSGVYVFLSLCVQVCVCLGGGGGSAIHDKFLWVTHLICTAIQKGTTGRGRKEQLEQKKKRSMDYIHYIVCSH